MERSTIGCTPGLSQHAVLRLDDEAVRVAIGSRLVTDLCEVHDCPLKVLEGMTKWALYDSTVVSSRSWPDTASTWCHQRTSFNRERSWKVTEIRFAERTKGLSCISEMALRQTGGWLHTDSMAAWARSIDLECHYPWLPWPDSHLPRTIRLSVAPSSFPRKPSLRKISKYDCGRECRDMISLP